MTLHQWHARTGEVGAEGDRRRGEVGKGVCRRENGGRGESALTTTPMWCEEGG